jgi:hypothetical protein
MRNAPGSAENATPASREGAAFSFEADRASRRRGDVGYPRTGKFLEILNKTGVVRSLFEGRVTSSGVFLEMLNKTQIVRTLSVDFTPGAHIERKGVMGRSGPKNVGSPKMKVCL